MNRSFILLFIFQLSFLIYSCSAPKNTSQTVPTDKSAEKKSVTDDTVVKSNNLDVTVDNTIYESLPVFSAVEILPPELVKSEHHDVEDLVRNDGIMNHYIINSKYGQFQAHGTIVLKVRVREIYAIAQLDERLPLKDIGKAAVDQSLKPFKAAVNVALNPVDTVTGIPGGIATYFKRSYYTAVKTVKTTGRVAAKTGSTASRTAKKITGSESSEDQAEQADVYDTTGLAEELFDWYFGVGGGEREIAAELGVDPYTSNVVLAEKLKSAANYRRLGKLGLGFVGIPSSAITSAVRDVNYYVWNKHPLELKELNTKRLKEMGVDEELIEEFLQNPFYSPSFQTVLITAVLELDDVGNLNELIKQSQEVTSIPAAMFYIESVIMALWYHNLKIPIEEVIPDTLFPVYKTKRDTLIAFSPGDYVSWTESQGQFITRAAEKVKDIDAEKAEVWVLGNYSERARNEVESLGFTVITNASDIIASTPLPEGDKEKEQAKEVNSELFKNLYKHDKQEEDSEIKD